MKKFKSGDRIIVTAKHIQSYEQIGTINYYSSSTSCKIRFDNWNGLGRKELVIKEIYLERYEDTDGIKESTGIDITALLGGFLGGKLSTQSVPSVNVGISTDKSTDTNVDTDIDEDKMF